MSDARVGNLAVEERQGVRTLLVVAHFDIVGYTKLISLDDEGTGARVRLLRATLCEPLIARHGGRLLQRAGDSMLVVFDSIVQAVGCAIAVQARVPAHPANAEAAHPIQFRVGIEVGDVIADGTDLHGEGVIVAVRLESACPPGGICISRGVHDHVQGRIAARVTPAGALALKNVPRPVEAFFLEVEPVDAAEAMLAETSTAPLADSGADPFGGRAAIAVMPLRGYGADLDQDFVDALSDDLIGALSRWRTFPVIARNSTFALAGKGLDAHAIGRELGARYVVGGSVRRRSDGRIRVAIELIDVESADVLLAETFEFVSDDPDAVQDEVVRAVAGILTPELYRQERERAVRRPPRNPTAYDLIRRGDWYRAQGTKEGLEQAQALYRDALAVDPRSVKAMVHLGTSFDLAAIKLWAPDRLAAHRESLRWAKAAMAIDPRDADAHYALGLSSLNLGQRAEAMQALRESLRLNPSNAFARANLGQLFNFLDRPDEAIPELNLALRLNPNDQYTFMWLPYFATSHYLNGRYRECLATSERAVAAKPDYPLGLRLIVAALGQLGLPGEAVRLLPLMRKNDGPLAKVEELHRRLFVASAADRLMDGWRKAGVT